MAQVSRNESKRAEIYFSVEFVEGLQAERDRLRDALERIARHVHNADGIDLPTTVYRVEVVAREALGD